MAHDVVGDFRLESNSKVRSLYTPILRKMPIPPQVERIE